MKKLLLLPMLLALIVFSLYHEDVDGMDTSTKAKVTEDIQIEEGILEIYNNSKNEINSSVEVNETKEEFSVEIKGDLNSTKETVIKLRAVVKNAQKLEACNYWWYENAKLIDMGATLEKAFEKGEHNITLVVRDANGEESNTSVIFSAYNYLSIRQLNYDAYYGNLLYTERIITNHKGAYVVYDDGTHSKELMAYDEDNHLVERIREYYRYPNENRKTVFSYDDKGNRLSVQTFNMEGISVDYRLNIYDDNSSLIDMKFGTSPDDIDEQPVYSNIEYEEIYDASAYVEVEVPKDIVRLNDSGKVVYEEHYYGDMKVVNTMSYNEENKLIKSERNSNSSFETSSIVITFDTEGNAVNTERKYEFKGHSSCHYRTNNTYTSKGEIKTNASVLLGGECPSYIDEVKREYTYDDKGSLLKVQAISDDGDVDGSFTTLKVIKEYINTLDI